MGKVQIVGIGPGNFENMTIRADRALAACDVIVGYPVYVDLVKDRYPGKELVSTPMTQEARRCQMALDLAKSGKTVALVCSGDSGIYGMAALVYELRGENSEPEVEVVPGLTAACSGGALLGGLCRRVQTELRIPCTLAENPADCVVRGTGMALENMELYGDLVHDYRKPVRYDFRR